MKVKHLEEKEKKERQDVEEAQEVKTRDLERSNVVVYLDLLLKKKKILNLIEPEGVLL